SVPSWNGLGRKGAPTKRPAWSKLSCGEHPGAGVSPENVLSKGGSTGRRQPGVNDQQVDGPREILAQQQPFEVARGRECGVAGLVQGGDQNTADAGVVVGHEDGFPVGRGLVGSRPWLFTVGHGGPGAKGDRAVATASRLDVCWNVAPAHAA